MEPHELRQLREKAGRAWQALGKISYGPTAPEMKSLALRRSLCIAQDMEAGNLLTLENLRCVHPGFGLAPKHLDSLLLGQRIGRVVKAGTPMEWSLLGEGLGT